MWVGNCGLAVCMLWAMYVLVLGLVLLLLMGAYWRLITGCCVADVGWVLGVMPVLVDAVGCWFSLRLVCGLLLGCCVGLIVLLMLVLFVMAFVVWLLDLRCGYLVLRWLVALFMLCSYDSALVLSGFVVSCGCLLLSSFC